MKRVFLLILVINLTLFVQAQVEKYSRVMINVEPSELRIIARQGIPPDAGYYDFKQHSFVAELTQREISKLNNL